MEGRRGGGREGRRGGGGKEGRKEGKAGYTCTYCNAILFKLCTYQSAV